MSEEIRCPTCNSALRVSEELLGQEVKCPRCDSIFTATANQPGPPREPPREQEPPMPRTAVRRWEDDRDEREPPRPRRRGFEEDEDHDRWDVRRRRRGGREYALSRVQGPGTLLQVYGGLCVLAGVGLFLLAVYGVVQLNQNLTPGAREDAIMFTVLGGLGTLFSGGLGALTCWAGTRMKNLRSYGLAMTVTILTFVAGFLVCLLVALVGIWPLVVLSDSAVREEFE
jgi:predicted Zn finger-like uncharacterized protein